MAKIVLLTIFMIWLGVAPLPVKVSVTPINVFHPGAVKITARWAQDERNRYICIGYDGPSYRRSCDPIEGAERRTVFELTFSSIPPGDYQAFAELFRVLPNQAILKEQPFHVLGDEP